MDLFKLLGTIAVDNSQAKSALKETQSAAKGASDSLNDTASSSDGASSKLGTAFGKIGGAAVNCAKVIGAGMAAGAGAVAALVTKSVQSYADYEQLVGGVETLFKDSADKVQKYAANAYKTAGLSANEYMETVTSFSASLLQSVGNDTDAAAEKANMAITDMSDNANKMGTDMALIQNAYNGFAKQNYTMLDNLKLGYGGTQEEMKRLLADAQAISGIEYDISSYADIVDAIHVIQTEMGITGTTAKEASATISGSVTSMKASWQNLLTAMASDDVSIVENFGDYVDAFSASVLTVADNLVPRISLALEGLGVVIEQLAPMLGEKIPELIGALLPSLVQSVVALLNSLVAALPGLLNALLACIPDVINAITTIFNAIVEALPTLMQAIVSALPTLLPALIDGLISMILTLVTNFVQILQPIIDYLPEIIISIVDALMANLPALIEGCVQLVVALVAALPEIILSLINAMPTVIISMVEGLLAAAPLLIDGFVQIWNEVNMALDEIIYGIVDFVVGLWDTLNDLLKPILEAGKQIIVKAWNAIKNAVSTTVNTVKSVVTNVWNGIKSLTSSVWNSIKTTTSNVWNGIKSAITKPIEAAKEKIRGIIDTIKGFFSNFKVSLPKIKLPHFSIKPSGWKLSDLLEGEIPKLGIDWYAKAMRNPMIMTEPTVFGYNAATGKLQGGGEAGSEVVSGTGTLMDMIGAAVASQNEALVYYMQKIIEVLATYFPQLLEALDMDIVLQDGVLVGRLAPKMNEELGRISARKDRGR